MPASSSTSATERPQLESNGCDSDHLEALDRDDCVLRLKAHGVGRVSAMLHGRPLVFPVNYAVHDDAVVIRTRAGGDIDLATNDAWAALEIDGADSLYHEGWSVLVVGRATHVKDPFELARIKLVRLSPWADESRCSVVRIPLDDVSGRRLRHRSSVNFADGSPPADPQRASCPTRATVGGRRTKV
jgi:nitroimidazol reductase NimA-like FMN-containing flavoprotein (pyridoxamine 5'-phosphate oxidase superfamily)